MNFKQQGLHDADLIDFVPTHLALVNSSRRGTVVLLPERRGTLLWQDAAVLHSVIQRCSQQLRSSLVQPVGIALLYL